MKRRLVILDPANNTLFAGYVSFSTIKIIVVLRGKVMERIIMLKGENNEADNKGTNLQDAQGLQP